MSLMRWNRNIFGESLKRSIEADVLEVSSRREETTKTTQSENYERSSKNTEEEEEST